MTIDPLEIIDAPSVIEMVSRPGVPREFVLNAARGVIPVPQDDLIEILAYLSNSSDEEVAATASNALTELPPRIVVGFARNQNLNASTLEWLSKTVRDAAVLEAVLRNRNTEDSVFEALARWVNPTLQEIIVINQERILRSPAILEALLANPLLSGDIRRRALEVQEEFFVKEKVREQNRLEAVLAKAEATEQEAIDEVVENEELLRELIEKAVRAEAGTESKLPEPVEDDSLSKSVYVQLAALSPGKRVVRAFRGTKEERAILIRDRNKLVCSAVVRSPRVTPSEIEAFASSRSVDEEVLRIIGTSREWTSKYPIVVSLVRNPKSPLGVTMPLISRLTVRDLRELSRDKNVSEGVRLMARKLFIARSKQ